MARIEHQAGLCQVTNGLFLYVSLPVGVTVLVFANAQGRHILARHLHVAFRGLVVTGNERISSVTAVEERI